VVSGELGTEILETIMRPTVEGMAQDNHPFRGILYAGLMLTPDGPKVLEYNVRLGDPEAQPLLMRMEDDLLPVLAAGAEGDFGLHKLRFKKEAAACVVLASAGYPAKPVKGEPIAGLETARSHEGVEVFHAGTALHEDDGRTIVSAGGRVLDVCATGDTLVEALRRTYAAAAAISWPSKVLRRDIGRRVLERQAD